jgi:ribosomal protein S2
MSIKNDNTTTWKMRLDHYVMIGRNKIHWLAIGLSTSVIVIASIIVMRILNNTLYYDFK